MAGKLDFNFFCQARVVGAQHRQHFGTRELGRHVAAFRQHLAQFGARQQQAVLLVVRAGACRGHAAALVAPEGPVDLERLGLERILRDFVEDMVRVERAIVAADAGVVAADDQVRAAVVLAEQGVQQRLARTGIAHVERVAGLDDGILDEVLLDQGADGLGAHVGRDVAGLELAEQRVDQHAVAGLDGDLGEILVRAVHRVTGLERRHRGPAVFLELFTGFGRRQELVAVLFLELADREHLHRTGDVHLALGHDHLDARVLEVGGLVDHHALVRLVDAVLLGHLHGGHDLAGLAVHQGDIRAFLDAVRGELVGRERDRDRPEQAVGHLHAVAHALPVGLGHEAGERGEAADAEHDDVADFA